MSKALVHSDALGVSIPTALVERLEVASSGSDELDAEVYCACNPGWRPGTGVQLGAVILPGARGVGGTLRSPEPVTTSLDAALDLAERVLPDHDVQITKGAKEDALVSVAHYLSVEVEEATARTMPLALCAAILKAKAHD